MSAKKEPSNIPAHAKYELRDMPMSPANASKKRLSCSVPGEGPLSDHPPPKKRKIGKNDGSGEDNRNDYYCWLCHKEGTVVCCELCPRVYHIKCLELAGELPADWVCPECEKIMVAECHDTRSKSMSMLTLDQLCTLLTYALERMEHKGSDPFQKPVDMSVFPNYSDYVFNPMDIETLGKNIRKRLYGSTEAFTADTKWILHNCIIYNGAQHKLTASAKMIVKICKHEMNEIELCPDCYLNSCIRENDEWFSELCRTPHTLVWAKLKGYPFWPAKALREADGVVDVRFFGAHDRSWVPVSQCFHLSKNIPTSLQKGKRNAGLDGAIEELNQHVRKLKEKFGHFEYAPLTPYDKTDSYKPTSTKPQANQSSSVKPFSPVTMKNQQSKAFKRSKLSCKTAAAVRSKYTIVSQKKAETSPLKLSIRLNSPENVTGALKVGIHLNNSDEIDGVETAESSVYVDTGVKDESKSGLSNVKKSFVSMSIVKKVEEKILGLNESKTDEHYVNVTMDPSIVKPEEIGHGLNQSGNETVSAKSDNDFKSSKIDSNDDNDEFEPDESEAQSSLILTDSEEENMKDDLDVDLSPAKRLNNSLENKESVGALNVSSDKERHTDEDKEHCYETPKVTDGKDVNNHKSVKPSNNKEEGVLDTKDVHQHKTFQKPSDNSVSNMPSNPSPNLPKEPLETVKDLQASKKDVEKDQENEKTVEQLDKNAVEEPCNSLSTAVEMESPPKEKTNPEIKAVEGLEEVLENEVLLKEKADPSERTLNDVNESAKDNNKVDDFSTNQHAMDISISGDDSDIDNLVIDLDAGKDSPARLSVKGGEVKSGSGFKDDTGALMGSPLSKETTKLQNEQDIVKNTPNSTESLMITGDKQSIDVTKSSSESAKTDIVTKIVSSASVVENVTTTPQDANKELTCAITPSTASHQPKDDGFVTKVTGTTTDSLSQIQIKKDISVPMTTCILTASRSKFMSLKRVLDSNVTGNTATSAAQQDQSKGSGFVTKAMSTTTASGSQGLSKRRRLVLSVTSNSALSALQQYLSKETRLVTKPNVNVGIRKQKTGSQETAMDVSPDETIDLVSDASPESLPTKSSSSRRRSKDRESDLVGMSSNAGQLTSMDGKAQSPMDTEASFSYKAPEEISEKFLKKIMNSVQKNFGDMVNEFKSSQMPSDDKLLKETEQVKWNCKNEIIELKQNFQLTVSEMQASWQAQREQMLKSMTLKHVQDLEKQKKRLIKEHEEALNEAKKKQWCANCQKEAIFYCCWNTSYCDYPCQQAHWPQHSLTCNQTNKNADGTDKGVRLSVPNQNTSKAAPTSSSNPNSNQTVTVSSSSKAAMSYRALKPKTLASAIKREEEKKGEARTAAIQQKQFIPGTAVLRQNIHPGHVRLASQPNNLMAPMQGGIFLNQGMPARAPTNLMILQQPMMQQALYPVQVQRQPPPPFSNSILFPSTNPAQQGVLGYNPGRHY